MSPSSPSGLPPDVGVVIAAGGRGERAGAGEPKQFRPIAGVPMLLRSIRPFGAHPRVRHIVVALPAEAADAPPSWLAEVAGAGLTLVVGGDTRAASVRNGLSSLDPECHLVLVHDAARPFVAPEIVDAVCTRAAEGVAAVPAVPVSDTIKRVDDGHAVIETVDRAGLWRAQTPQGFPRAMLEEAFGRVADRPNPDYTDEAALVEACGFPVQVVPDRASNLKITTPADFLLAEALLAQ
jgi:2-C-methyl-D-erythritol 4-phosphate cytidylyltransferase